MLQELERATVRFGGRAVLDEVDLAVAEHEVVCVLGPSGSGKSTLLRAVAGLQPLDGGRVAAGFQLEPGRNAADVLDAGQWERTGRAIGQQLPLSVSVVLFS